MQTRLTQADLKRIEYQARLRAGDPPTLESLKRDGYRESTWQIGALRAIADTGRVITLLVAEAIQAGAALGIGVIFALLEYQRVFNGSLALGQPDHQAVLIAVAVVTANVVHPIYSLRALRGQNRLQIVRPTLRGFLAAFWRRIVGQPTTSDVEMFHNPTLNAAAAVITWSTVLLAVYDILGPLMAEIFVGRLSRPAPIAALELLMGFGLSVAGVFFLQSAAHEIGVRTLTDQPSRLLDLLQERTAAYDQHLDDLREDERERYIAAKLADLERTDSAPSANPTSALNGRNHSTAELPGIRQG